MPALELFCPSTIEEAIAILETSPVLVDSPTQHRHRTSTHLSDTFASGRRRPEWVWAARSTDGRVVGHVAALAAGSGRAPDVLDHFAVPSDPAQARELMAHATQASRSLGVREVSIFAPPGSSMADPALQPLLEPLSQAGWFVLAERRHYEFAASPQLCQHMETRLQMEQLHDPADVRLVAMHREVMRGTLDVHDAADIERVGFDVACQESLTALLDADPVDCIWLAFDEANEPVGMVSGLTSRSGWAYVLFVGVDAAHRGNGYGCELLAWMTRHLVAQSATTLIADTDNSNAPMSNAFAVAGWIQSETRIDLIPGPSQA